MVDSKAQYINRILKKYLQVHDTPDSCNRSEYQLAERLFEQGIRAEDVETAILLATVRRVCRSINLSQLNPIRSLNYFVPVIYEVVQESYPHEYLQYLEKKINDLINCRARKRIQKYSEI